MTDQDPKYQSNQEHNNIPEGGCSVTNDGTRSRKTSSATYDGTRCRKPAPNTGLLTFVFLPNIGYLGLFIGSALMVGEDGQLPSYSFWDYI